MDGGRDGAMQLMKLITVQCIRPACNTQPSSAASVAG
jgi:hypothetical protein